MQFNEILEFLKSIPDVIWSGLIASLVTLSGVFLSNLSNTNRLKLQLQHDADEKAKERTSTLRREVYLRTVEELVKANAHLSSLPQIDVTKTNLADGLQNFFSSAARLQLVAEPKTSLLISKLSANYGEIVCKLMIDLIPLIKAKNDIDIANEHYSRTQAEIYRILAEQRKINESGTQNPIAFQTLQDNYKFEQKRALEISTERNESWKLFNKYNLNFQTHLLSELGEISYQQIPLLVEIRRDLGLIGDLTEIETHMKQQWDRMEAHYETLIATLVESAT